jgi:hypothetical protein
MEHAHGNQRFVFYCFVIACFSHKFHHLASCIHHTLFQFSCIKLDLLFLIKHCPIHICFVVHNYYNYGILSLLKLPVLLPLSILRKKLLEMAQ